MWIHASFWRTKRMGHGRRVTSGYYHRDTWRGGWCHLLKCIASLALISLLVPPCLAQLEFTWVSGPWRECAHRTCGPGGIQYRDVTCVLRSGQRVLEENCALESKPADWRACHKPCGENVMLGQPEVYPESPQERNPASYDPGRDSQDQVGSTVDWGPRETGTRWEYPHSAGSSASDVEWVVSPFGSCRLKPDAAACGLKNGIQYRNVTCQAKASRSLVSESRCLQGEPRPLTSQQCEYLCRQDCIVSNFSVATSCDNDCHTPNRTWIRTVIVPPRHRGAHCPALSAMEPCAKCAEAFTYQLSEWSPCTSLQGSYLNGLKSHPLVGYQTREISCLQSKGVLASLRSCSDTLPETILIKDRACVMPQDCKLSGWSSFIHHNSSCIRPDGTINFGYKIRTRKVLQLPLGEGRPCPSLLTDYITQTHDDIGQLRPCKRAKWIKSAWSPCREVPGYNNCGTGMQTRTAVCVQMDVALQTERPVAESQCSQPRPVEAKSCKVECNWDCSVSQWSAWSSCQAGQCTGVNLRRRRQGPENLGRRYRTRSILTLPGPSGQSCPHLSESRMCHPEACFRWNITREECQPHRGTCGEGSLTQRAQCINRDGFVERDLQCNLNLHTVENWAKCYVPCPEDCVLGEWSAWSTCPDPCQLQPGVRSERTRHRAVLAYHDPGRSGRPCPALSNLHEAEPCPILFDCAIYRWVVGPWESCALTSDQVGSGLASISSQQFGRRCGRGLSRRTVECKTERGEVAEASRCVEIIRPVSTQQCNVTCPVDCHVSEWSEWSDCGVTCLAVRARQDYPSKVRQRYVLQDPEHGGQDCPRDLLEQQKCLDLPVCQVFFWETSDWSECILPPVVPLCGHGLRARNISCKHADSSSTRQVALSDCLERLGTMPAVTEHCHRPCESECQLSPWSQWTQCWPGGCDQTRFRYRRLEGVSKSNPKCRDTERYPRDQHETCPCLGLQPILVGGWSDCILSEDEQNGPRFAQMSLGSIQGRQRRTNGTGLDGTGTQPECGKGKRYMALSCLSQGETTRGASRCIGEQYEAKNCSIPCPVDCELAAWTEWSQCSVHCGSGTRYRNRTVLTPPANGGRMCPFMDGGRMETQTKLCTVDCDYYKWRTDRWGQCEPHSGRSCGEGSHSRVVRCVTVGSKDAEQIVQESLCPTLDKPVTVKSCSLPCPSECVLSEWSEWTRCREPCDGKQLQSRERKVLRPPARYTRARGCRKQREDRPCRENCAVYKWELSDWASCLVNGGRAECGAGHKEKYVICRNQRGEKVEPYLCDEHAEPVTEPLVVSCEVPCDNDCLMSSWAPWSHCSTECGLGETRRRRTVLQKPVGNGRKCPVKLEQTKPCFHKGCFTWSVSDWSPCTAQVGVCGATGVQERNVSCVNDEGRAVNSSKCTLDPEKLVMQTIRSCKVPCPGQCKLSEWSSWTKCYIGCEDFRQGIREGVRARSRAIMAHPSPGNPPCDGKLWEDAVCYAQRCTWFEWDATDWNYMTKSRRVTCRRNDGLVVTGPCEEQTRPADKLLCEDPVCLVPAVCRDTNTCECAHDSANVLQLVNSSALTCVMNGTALGEDAGSSKLAKSPNIWMYAVIAVGTLFVIAVTAALYNMCELFRTGPRPRRKGQASTTASSANSMHSLHHQQQQQQRRQLQHQQQHLQGKSGSLDEIDECTTLVESGNGGGPACPGNGSVSRGENLYKQIDRGRERGLGVGEGEGGQDESSRSLLQQQQTPGGAKTLPRDSPSTFVIVPSNAGSSTSRSSPGFSSSSHRRYSQPTPDPPIYTNFSSPDQLQAGAASIPPAAQQHQISVEFIPDDIPEIDDPSSPTASSASPPTVITTTNTINSAASPTTPGYGNIPGGGAPPASLSISGDTGRKTLYTGNSINTSRANGPSQVSTISRDEHKVGSVALRPNQLPKHHQPHGSQTYPQQRPNIKHNRRYGRIHRMLPTRMMQCLAREDDNDVDSSDEDERGGAKKRSSKSMTPSQNTNTKGGKHRSLERFERDPNHGMKLTKSHGSGFIDEGDYVEDFKPAKHGSYYRPSPSPSSSYGNSLLLHEHACMLPPPPPPAPATPSPSHELRPGNLDLAVSVAAANRPSPEVHYRALQPSRLTDNAPLNSAEKEMATSLPQTSQSFAPVLRSADPRQGYPHADGQWPSDYPNRHYQKHMPRSTKSSSMARRITAGTPSGASSDSMALSTLTDHMLTTFHQPENSVGTESCSQSSLQLGDTAETLLHEDTRVHVGRNPDLDIGLIERSLDRDADSLSPVPESQERGKKATNIYGNPQTIRNHSEAFGSKSVYPDNLSHSLPLPPPAPPSQTETLGLDLDPSSSSLLSSCSPDLQRLLQPALSNSRVPQDAGVFGKPTSELSKQQPRFPEDNDNTYGFVSPLHVDVAGSSVPRNNFAYPLSQEGQRPHHHGKLNKSSPSPQSFHSDTPFYVENQKPGRSSRNGTRHQTPAVPVSASPTLETFPNASSVPVNHRQGGKNWGEPKNSPGSRSNPYQSKSSASLPEKVTLSGNHRELMPSSSPRQLSFLPPDKNTRGTSEDSGRSTLPHSPSASPRGQQHHRPGASRYDQGNHSHLSEEKLQGGQGAEVRPGSGTFTPVLVTQASTESGHDSPTPSVCDQCQREMEMSRGDFYMSPSTASTPVTPRSRSQMSNMSGVETSV